MRVKRYRRVLDIVDELNLSNLGALDDETIQRCERMFLALDRWSDEAAVSLHGKFPVCPHGAAGLDGVSDVKEGVDSDRAGREPGGIVLVIQPVRTASS